MDRKYTRERHEQFKAGLYVGRRRHRGADAHDSIEIGYGITDEYNRAVRDYMTPKQAIRFAMEVIDVATDRLEEMAEEAEEKVDA